MNLQFIKYFVVLTETLNFTRASEKVHVVQSTFSSGIKKLEEHLETKLFHRDKRNVSLTRSGEVLLPKAKRLLALWSDIEEDFLQTEWKTLELGFVQNLSLDAVIPYINEFKSFCPLSDVNITEDKHKALLKLTKNNELDAFFTEQQEINVDSLEATVVASEKLFLAVNRKHHLAIKDSLELTCLHKERFVERSHCALYQDVFLRFNELSIEPNKVFTAHNNETVAALVSSGMGITLMPKPIFSLPEIKFIPLKNDEFVRDILLVWNRNSTNTVLRDFITMVTRA
ncbi:LysR family transcriptional regulator [uncultured Aquimarina sp.]|uniref:LysR family transcriptional regulator n=1 Tax=uncultured Aquimarina sp. TaxID=575652 RepID=UPI002637C000|nr:LysR family transcriptional regulator [uncultured Aquimarina sp.]